MTSKASKRKRDKLPGILLSDAIRQGLVPANVHLWDPFSDWLAENMPGSSQKNEPWMGENDNSAVESKRQ